MAFLGLFGRKRYQREGFELYGAAVRAARSVHYYTVLGVPDTMDGRFDMVGVYVFLVIHRLQNEPAPGGALAQAVFDAMFMDMDTNLRELGVSDMGLARRMKAMWEAFNGRAAAYAVAVDAADEAGLAEALARNVWRGAARTGDAASLAGIVLLQHGHLARQATEQLLKGRVEFLPVTAAAA